MACNRKRYLFVEIKPIMREAVERALIAFYRYPTRDVLTQQDPRIRMAPNFGLTVTEASVEQSTISIDFTFLSGQEYCCNSPACHFFDLFFKTDWEHLRSLLQAEGTSMRSPMRLEIRVICEAGALFAVDPGERDKSRITFIPEPKRTWTKYVTDEAIPKDAQVPVQSSELDRDGLCD